MALVLTQNAKFNPFTFQDLAAPYLLVDKAAGEVEEALDSTLSKANLMRKYAEEEPNAEYSKAYKAYADNLEHQAEQFSKYGLSAGLRDSIRMARNNYGKVVTPIELAAAKREDYYKMMASNPNNIYRNNGVITLSDVMNNKVDMSYLDPKTLMTEASIGAKSKSQEALQKAIASGYSSEEALRLARIAADNYKSEYLNSLGMDSFSGDNNNKITNAVNLGIEGAFADVVKGEYLDAAKRSDIKYRNEGRALEWAKFKHNQEKEIRDLATKGYRLNADGSISYDPSLVPPSENSTSSNDSNKKPDLFPSIKLGAVKTGDTSNYDKYSSSLMVDKDGKVTTTEIQKLAKQYKEAADNLTKAKATPEYITNPEKFAKYGYYGRHSYREGARAKEQNIKLKQERADKLLNEYNKKVKELSDLSKKYSHFGGKEIDNIRKGLQLEKEQSTSPNSSIVFSSTTAGYNNVRGGIRALLDSGAKLYHEGKAVSDSSLDKILSDDKRPLTIKVNTGHNPGFRVVYKGDEFELKNANAIDVFNNDIFAVDKYLKDFSKEGVRNTADMISDEELKVIYGGNPEAVLRTNPDLTPKIQGKYYVYTLIGNNKDIVKIITNGKEVLGFSTLYDAINGGSFIAASKDALAQNMLAGLAGYVN